MPSPCPFQAVPLKTVIEDTISLCHENFLAHDVALSVPDVPETCVVECHPTQLMEVLVNLLSNALHAVEHHPEKWAVLSVEDEGDYVEIAVTDSGEGIPEPMAAALFDPFTTTKGPGKGTGLGLSIARRIVQNHNGDLTVDTSCANTRFVIHLPKKQTPLADSNGGV